MDLRLDANEAWPAAELLERVEPLLPFRPSALEQPVPHAEVEALAELRPRLGVPVMLDESLCGYPDAVAAIARRDGRPAQRAALEVRRDPAQPADHGPGQRSGLGLQLGCHPGETAHPLGRRPARRQPSRGPALRRGLVRPAHPGRNLTREDITFRYGGRAEPAGRAGTGRRGRSRGPGGDDDRAAGDRL